MTPDHYQTLRVVRGAEDAVIQAAYRALVRLYHPDENPGPFAEACLREINAAYEVLCDPVKRAFYDSTGYLRGEVRLEQSAISSSDTSLGQQTGKFRLAKVANDGRAGELTPLEAKSRSGRAVANMVVALAALVGILIAIAEFRPANTHLATKSGSSAAAFAAPQTHQGLPSRVVSERLTPAMVEDNRELIHSQLDIETAPSRVLDAKTGVLHLTGEKPRARRRDPGALGDMQQGGGTEAPIETATEEAATSAVQETCRNSPRPNQERCTSARLLSLERIAKGFAAQSMQRADWSKQQLILSARIRSNTARSACRSEDCMADAYVRQISEVSSIMEGRRPIP